LGNLPKTTHHMQSPTFPFLRSGTILYIIELKILNTDVKIKSFLKKIVIRVARWYIFRPKIPILITF
jgi:hypothetical protein